MDKENNSISDKLMMMTLKLHDFVDFEIQNEDSGCKDDKNTEQINKSL